MAGSDHCAGMHRCRGSHGWPGATIVQGCTGVAEAMDGRERPLSLFVWVSGLQKREAGIVLALYVLYLLIKFIQL